MKFVCISASNIEFARARSTSTRACKLIREILLEDHPEGVEVEIVPLIDYQLLPCTMEGLCYSKGFCARDEDFNRVYRKLIEADAVFIVSPHYAPIPSKLVILFEKLEEMVYLHTYNDPEYRFTLYNKPVGVVAHGGQMEAALTYYKSALLDPIATALTMIQMRVIGASEKWPYGVAFGVKNVTKPDDSIFVEIEHDWPAIREQITPLVRNVAAQVFAC